MTSAPSPAFTVHPVPGEGTEDVVILTEGPHEGSVYTGTGDGSIWRVSHDGRRLDLVGRTGGRPLGLELLPDGRVLVCDARRGLLRLDPATAGVERLVDSVEGRQMLFCNNAAVADDGTVWFSDSSTRYGIEEWKKDFGQVTRTGRLLRLDPDGTLEVVLDGLAFANGVTLSAAGDFVCVAESGARTLVRRWISGPRAGLRDLLCQDLPGYPDNVARGSDGLIWVTIGSPSDPLIERVLAGPLLLRRLITNIPDRLRPAPADTVRVQAYDDEGALVHDLDIDPAAHGASFHMVTGVREHEGRVWMSSLHESAVAVWDGGLD